MIDNVLQDVRLAFRTLTKAPTVTAAIIATIALAIGATTAMFTVVNAVVLRPLPFPESEKAVMLCETNPAIGDRCGASPKNVADWARMSRSLDSAGVARTEGGIVNVGGETFGVPGGIVMPGFFRVLRTRPALGRLIEDRDMPSGANQVIVVTDAFWRKRLGGDPAVVGRQIILNDTPVTIIGVLPPDSYVPGYLSIAQIWKPLTASIDNVEERRWRGFMAIGRLAADASPETFDTELKTIRARLAQAYPDANKDWGVRFVGLRTQVVGDVSRTLWIFLGAVAFVLLIACANVASLLLVRASGRASEFAVRASLGARRGRLAQQLVTESLVLSLAGGALGLLLASWTTTAFVALAPTRIPRLAEVSIDGRVMAFAFLLSVITAIVFGSAPARQASRADVNAILKGHRGGRAADSRMRAALVVVELALALMLLVGAGLLTRSFAQLVAWDPGFDRSGVMLTFMFPPSRPGGVVSVMERVRDEVRSVPGVRAVALGSGGPVFGGGDSGDLAIEGRPAFRPAEMPLVDWFDITPDYFNTLGIRIVRGRQLTDYDTMEAPHVAIVNETFARRFFPDGNAIGHKVTVDRTASEIVGVAADAKPWRPDEATPPQIYWPIKQYKRGAAYLIIRTVPGITGIEKAVQARVASVDSRIHLSAFETIDEKLEGNLVSPRFNLLLVASFALVALLMAAVGVYGVIACSVAGRTREFGVHIALGATPRLLVSAIVAGGLKLAAIGIALGLAGALAVGRLLSSLLFGLPATDPIALASASAVFVLVAIGACWLPARRATRVDPIAALRVE